MELVHRLTAEPFLLLVRRFVKANPIDKAGAWEIGERVKLCINANGSWFFAAPGGSHYTSDGKRISTDAQPQWPPAHTSAFDQLLSEIESNPNDYRV